MELARQFWPQHHPVFLCVGAKIIAIVTHIVSDLAVDLPRAFVPQWPRIAVCPYGAVDRFPRFELIAAAAFASKHRFEVADLFDSHIHLPLDRPAHRPLRPHPSAARRIKRIFVFVYIYELPTPKIDRVGVEDPRAAKEIRMFQLKAECAPAAGRGTLNDPG